MAVFWIAAAYCIVHHVFINLSKESLVYRLHPQCRAIVRCVMICNFTSMETTNLKPQILNHTLMLKNASTLHAIKYGWLLESIIFIHDR
jgi:hypothetical protein